MKVESLVAFIILFALILSMAITHANVATSGSKGTAEQWNDDHVIGEMDKPKNFTTLIVAASDSLDTTRADYVCDGIDDQDTINEAIGDLPAGGGRISLLEGTYVLTDPVVYDKDNVTIQGLGRATIIQTSDDVMMVFAANRTGLLLQDVRMIGSGAGNNNNIGIELDTVLYSIIRGCWLEDMGSTALYLDNASNYNLIANNIFSSNDDRNIDIVDSGNVVLSGNILDSSGTGDVSVSISNSNNCIVTGNIVTDADSHGIQIYGSEYVIFSGNNIRGANADGLLLTNDSDYCVVSGNTICNNTAWDIRINGPTNDKNLVLGNVMVGTGGGLSDTGTGTVSANNVI